MKALFSSVFSNQAIPFILGIVVLVIIVFIRFFKVAASITKQNKDKKSENDH